MPVIKSAKKKLRQDKKRTIERAKVEEVVKEAVKKAVASPTEKTVKAAASMLDKAAKKHIFHKNKVARIKSRLAHLLKPRPKADRPLDDKGKIEAPAKTKSAKVSAKGRSPKAKKTVKKPSAKGR